MKPLCSRRLAQAYRAAGGLVLPRIALKREPPPAVADGGLAACEYSVGYGRCQQIA
jgi:hypothetical protein